MQTIIAAIESLLGYLMNICYTVTPNYGIAIILFTFLTKIILIPITVMVHKNAIKMVKMLPDLNFIKAENFGNGDRIAEEQMKLYKKEKYHPLGGLIPLFIQIFLLILVINVIYKPLQHILQLDSVLIESVIQNFCAFTGLNPEVGSIQLAVVNFFADLSNKAYFQQIASNDISNAISGLKMKFLIFNLADVPLSARGISMIIPLLAGGSAFFLSFVQEHSNVLQAEQSKLNKLLTMLLSVGLALYLGFFVPIGVGMYWIFSNFFSIFQLLLLNIVINPKKYIDYEKLQASKEALEKVQKYAQPVKKWYEKDPYRDREKVDNKKFLKIEDKQLVFYSEKSGFYKYFKGIIEVILQETDIIIHYVTSDPNDVVFDLQNSRFQAYYISDLKLITFMMKMDTDIVVMTMPDLEKHQIKRSYVRKDVEYIYLHHAINSINLTLRTGALDYFDTIFAHSGYCVEEIRQIEKLHRTKEKVIVEYGYSLLDELIEKYNSKEQKENGKKIILIAPSWQKSNILDSCIEEILQNLMGQGYKIIIRPHPQYLRYSSGQLDYLQEKYCAGDNDIIIERDFSSNETIYNADILITDWSSISYEYSFSTLKPTLYINTPMKVMNPEYKDIKCIPYDITIRSQIGKELNLEELDKCLSVVKEFLENREDYSDQLRRIREKNIFNIGSSAKVGASYIINRLEEIKKEKVEEEWMK